MRNTSPPDDLPSNHPKLPLPIGGRQLFVHYKHIHKWNIILLLILLSLPRITSGAHVLLGLYRTGMRVFPANLCLGGKCRRGGLNSSHTFGTERSKTIFVPLARVDRKA